MAHRVPGPNAPTGRFCSRFAVGLLTVGEAGRGCLPLSPCRVGYHQDLPNGFQPRTALAGNNRTIRNISLMELTEDIAMSMRTKVNRKAPPDYPTLMAILAIVLSAVVICGIICSYADRPSLDDISARISILHRHLPSDL